MMRRVEKKLVMLLLATTCISIAMAERFEAVENKWEKIADMLEGRNDAGGLRYEEKLKTCEMYKTSTNGNLLKA